MNIIWVRVTTCPIAKILRNKCLKQLPAGGGPVPGKLIYQTTLKKACIEFMMQNGGVCRVFAPRTLVKYLFSLNTFGLFESCSFQF